VTCWLASSDADPMPVARVCRYTLAGLAGVLVAAVLCTHHERSQAAALVVVLGLPAVTVYTITGLLLPWDQLSFWLAQGLLEGLLVGPVLGHVLADLAFGGVTLSRTTLVRAYVKLYCRTEFLQATVPENSVCLRFFAPDGHRLFTYVCPAVLDTRCRCAGGRGCPVPGRVARPGAVGVSSGARRPDARWLPSRPGRAR
jgi:hypothetical protein